MLHLKAGNLSCQGQPSCAAKFCAGKRAVLMVEEGAPDYIERDLNTILRRRDLQTKVSGKDVLPMGGEYTAPVLTKGLRQFLAVHARELLGDAKSASENRFPLLIKILDAREKLSLQVHPPASKAAGLKGEPKTEMWFIADAAPGAEL